MTDYPLNKRSRPTQIMKIILITFHVAYLAVFGFLPPLQAEPQGSSSFTAAASTTATQTKNNWLTSRNVTSTNSLTDPNGTSVITGKVTGPDGITPIPGILVQIYRIAFWESFSEFEGTTTDEDGSYRIQNLVANTYRIRFSDPSFGICSSEFYVNAPTLETAKDIVVGEGATVSGIDASLLDGSEITGRVTGPDGVTPLENVEVIAYYLSYYGDQWIRGNDTTTQADGSYSIRRLPAGTYRISFSGPNGRIYAEEYYNDVIKFESAENIAVGKDVTIIGINASLTKSGQINGTITGPNGATPLGGISVTAYRPNGFGGWEPAKYTYTNSDGKYYLQYLVAGNYRIGFSDQDGGVYGDEFYDNVRQLESAMNIVVGEGITVGGVDASMIEVGKIAGNVTGQNGATPVLGILVTAYRSDGIGGWSLFRETHTRFDGSYLLKGLIAGSYRVKFSDFENRKNMSDVYPWDEKVYVSEYYNNVTNLADAVSISVGENATISGIDASLIESGKITGTVTGPDGVTPVQGIIVVAYLPNDYENKKLTYTAADGSYSLGGLAAGTYRVKFVDWMVGIYTDEYYNDASDEQSAIGIFVAENTAVSGINASLREAGKISGNVTGPDGVTPLKDIEVLAYRLEGTNDWQEMRATYTRTDGFYTLRGLTAGNYRIRFYDSKNKVYPDKYYDGVADIESAKDVVVAANAIVSAVNIRMGAIPPIPTAPKIEVVENLKSLGQSALINFKIPSAKVASVTKYLTIRNVGGSALTGLKISKKGIRASDFIIGKLKVNSLNPNGSVTFKVTFKPSASARSNAVMMISSTDATKNPFIVRLSGKGKGTKAKNVLIASHPADSTIGSRSNRLADQIMVGTDFTGKSKFNTLTILKSPQHQTAYGTVEVSPDLMDWFSGTNHTTVITDNEKYYKVRDNMPISKDRKRFIRLKNEEK